MDDGPVPNLTLSEVKCTIVTLTGGMGLRLSVGIVKVPFWRLVQWAKRGTQMDVCTENISRHVNCPQGRKFLLVSQEKKRDLEIRHSQTSSCCECDAYPGLITLDSEIFQPRKCMRSIFMASDEGGQRIDISNRKADLQLPELLGAREDDAGEIIFIVVVTTVTIELQTKSGVWSSTRKPLGGQFIDHGGWLDTESQEVVIPADAKTSP